MKKHPIFAHIWFILIQLYSHRHHTHSNVTYHNYACILYIWAYIIILRRSEWYETGLWAKRQINWLSSFYCDMYRDLRWFYRVLTWTTKIKIVCWMFVKNQLSNNMICIDKHKRKTALTNPQRTMSTILDLKSFQNGSHRSKSFCS